MLRIVLFLLLATSLLVPRVANASPQLIGRTGDGPYRLLDADLKVIPGTPPLPSMYGTTLSPDGRRIAGQDADGLLVVDRETGLQIARFPFSGQMLWPTSSRIVVVDSYSTPHIITSIDVRTGQTTRTRLRGKIFDVEQAGHAIRFLVRNGPLPGLSVVGMSASGTLRRPIPVRAPATAKWPGGRLSGRLVLVTTQHQVSIVPIGGTPRPVDLSPSFYEWLTPTLLWTRGFVAHIDRDTGDVIATAHYKPNFRDVITPFRGGFISGFGRERFDRHLHRVARNPHPALTASRTLLAGGRLYSVLVTCNDSPHRPGAVIADARTGRKIARVHGDWQLQLLGNGDTPIGRYDDCD